MFDHSIFSTVLYFNNMLAYFSKFAVIVKFGTNSSNVYICFKRCLVHITVSKYIEWHELNTSQNSLILKEYIIPSH